MRRERGEVFCGLRGAGDWEGFFARVFACHPGCPPADTGGSARRRVALKATEKNKKVKIFRIAMVGVFFKEL
jgi:hypothetical protein